MHESGYGFIPLDPDGVLRAGQDAFGAPDAQVRINTGTVSAFDIHDRDGVLAADLDAVSAGYTFPGLNLGREF